VTPETAAQAAQLLRDIEALQSRADAIKTAAENKHFIAGGAIPTDNPDLPLDLPQMTAYESKAIFDAAMAVLSVRLKALTAKLAAM
jgi:hypothetical protein